MVQTANLESRNPPQLPIHADTQLDEVSQAKPTGSKDQTYGQSWLACCQVAKAPLVPMPGPFRNCKAVKHNEGKLLEKQQDGTVSPAREAPGPSGAGKVWDSRRAWLLKAARNLSQPSAVPGKAGAQSGAELEEVRQACHAVVVIAVGTARF